MSYLAESKHIILFQTELNVCTVQAEEPEAGLTNPPENSTPVSEFKKWNIALNVNILI